MENQPVYSVLQSADLAELGERLRAARRACGFTQQDLAGGDISAAYVSRIEAGQRRPELAVAQRLCDRLGISVDFLVTGVEPAQAHEIDLQIRYAELALRSGEAADALTQLEALAERASGSAEQIRMTARLLGLAREAQADLAGATLALEQALAGATGILALQIATDLCRCYREAGDLARAIQVGEAGRAQAATEDLLGRDEEIRLSLSLSAAYFERGDVVYAAQLCGLAIQRAEAHDSPAARAAGYWNASVIAAERGQHRDALTMAERALGLLGEGEDQSSLAKLRLQYGVMLLAQEPPELDAAMRALRDARGGLVESGCGAAEVARCDVAIARAYYLGGEPDQAEHGAADALDRIGASAPFAAAEAHIVLGAIASQRADLELARRQYTLAVTALTGAQADREVAELWYELGDLLEEAGDDVGARDAFRRASASLGLRRTRTAVHA